MNPSLRRAPHLVALAALAALGAALPTQAAVVDVTVTVNNLVPANGIAFAPLHVGFHGGGFDAFDLGGVATTPIVSVAEGGPGGAWQAAFAAADPTVAAVLVDRLVHIPRIHDARIQSGQVTDERRKPLDARRLN